ncbi:MAG: Gfo/Idh/MocA family oxidoreductase [Verrucomicrobia bacterium]|nr:Gfo/Idh/MocA family oxidoreductase [Verrucomicrobiota bacterium]
MKSLSFDHSTRRQFLRRGAAAVALLALPQVPVKSARAAAGAVPPNRRITVGIIGTGLMGAGHVNRMMGDPGVQVLGVCDVDRSRREAAQGRVEAKYAAEAASGTYHGCKAYNDYRELLARPDLDAVVIVTPDHWHALQSVHAAEAGKDVYCEKPISVTIAEGRRVVEAVRGHRRVFQTGTQYRSIPTIRRVCEFVRGGGLGRVKSVFTLLDPLSNFMRHGRFQPYADLVQASKYTTTYAPIDLSLPAEPVPEGLDWELWVGPAPWHPYHTLYHTNPSPGVVPWSFADAFGVAALTWHLAHSADVIQYALGVETSGPVELIHPREGKYPTLTCRYASGTLLHFVDHWGLVKDAYGAVPGDARLAGNFGGVFVGEAGWITSMSTGGPVEGGPAEVFEKLALPTREVNIGSNNHHANWLECTRTRAQPSCDEELGHRTASLGHLAMIAYKLGRSLRWDPVREEFPGDAEANALRARPLRAPWTM